MKKALLVMILVISFGSLLSAQQAHKNVVYFGNTGLFGFALCYERMFLPNFSLVLDAGYAFYMPEYYASVRLRWFPGSDSDGVSTAFFMSAGIGYGGYLNQWGLQELIDEEDENEYKIYGAIFSPGVGFKIGFGKRRGFIFTPALDLDIFFGEKSKREDDGWSESRFGVGLSPNLKLLFGYAF